MKTELCAYSVDACRTAARLGVDRVELCASPAEGGVTPSYATIERVAAIEGLDVSVMIRPRGGDFLYSDDEFETMLLDIERARDLTKIQSLPIIGREWEYMFYIDVMYNDYTRYRQSIDAVRPLTKQLKILGEYKEGKSTF